MFPPTQYRKKITKMRLVKISLQICHHQAFFYILTFYSTSTHILQHIYLHKFNHLYLLINCNLKKYGNKLPGNNENTQVVLADFYT